MKGNAILKVKGGVGSGLIFLRPNRKPVNKNEISIAINKNEP